MTMVNSGLKELRNPQIPTPDRSPCRYVLGIEFLILYFICRRGGPISLEGRRSHQILNEILNRLNVGPTSTLLAQHLTDYSYSQRVRLWFY